MMRLFRINACLARWHIPLVPRLLNLVNRILYSTVLPPSVRVGKNVTFAYQELATVIHGQAVIGNNTYVGPNVIIGGRAGRTDVPVIGDNVVLGAGSRILGPVTIGTGATVAAGAVVITDVAPGTTVAGVPAHTIDRTGGAARQHDEPPSERT